MERTARPFLSLIALVSSPSLLPWHSLAAVELVVRGIDVGNGRFPSGQSSNLLGRRSVGLIIEHDGNPPNGGILLGLDIPGSKETVLLDGNLSRLLGDSENGESDNLDPRLLQTC